MKLALLVLLVLLGLALWASLGRASEVPRPGTVAPGFALPDQNGKTHRLSDYRGRWVALYFYPKDDTPGCTQEACLFRDDLHKLAALGAEIVGISVDDRASHAAFARKYRLPFPLLADRDGKVAAQYGARMNLGLVKFARRHTFLIDPQGRVAKVYLKVDTSRHAQEILNALTKLKGTPR